jgi:hypothetical protein
MKKTLLPLILTIFIFPVSAQQMKLEVIPLNNRTLEQLVEVIRPLLVPGGSVSGMNNQLIIKSTVTNLDEIKKVLASIDMPQRRLIISVKQDIIGLSNSNKQAVSGQYDTGDVSISNQAPPQQRGLIISGRDSNDNVINYQVGKNQQADNDQNSYSIQALEGEPAFISSGQSVPITNQTAYINRNGVVVQDTVEYRDISSGFYVLPRLNGDRVTLMVAPRTTSVNPGTLPSFNVQNVQTTVSGRLGDWIEIGGLGQSSQSSRQSFLEGGTNQRQESRNILIKVEEIR